MCNVFNDIRLMHRHYGIPINETPNFLPRDVARFRLKFLLEELTEYADAVINEDIEEQIDGLIDLMVVAAGTLDMMGVHGEVHWNEVLRANMEKEVVKDASESKRGSSIDLKKPDGWVAPNHEILLHHQGYKK